ncbi:PDZ and LIM domain protein 3a [Salminus brasiliensis]|uniref:PDZ and LIM domain protein 3a n=1 Tax=Salminus brasiliensis TaxID=930266 RepID=UPI003B83178B
MPHCVVLEGPAPWGFRLIGGKDFNQPLTIARISSGSKASMVDLSPGDIILAIDGISTANMMHCEAQNRIREATYQLTLTIERPETKLWSPRVSEDGRAHPFKINLEAERQEYRPIGTGHNRRAVPFVAAANIDDKRQVVSSAYNSPIGLYSSGNIQDALHGQLRGLIHNKPESPRILTSIEESDVYQMLQRDRTEEEPHEPRQSGSFKALQDYINSEGTRPIVTRTVRAPTTKPPTPAGNLHRLPMCDKCGNGIVGTVVKVRDKYRHPGCFVCSDCEENLKQKGYFFIDDELYCETHAHARSKPPEGHDLIAAFPSE